jgi:hypothetical protein
MFNTTPRPLYHQKRPGTHCTAGWTAGPVWTCAKKLAPIGIFFKIILQNVRLHHMHPHQAKYSMANHPIHLFQEFKVHLRCLFNKCDRNIGHYVQMICAYSTTAEAIQFNTTNSHQKTIRSPDRPARSQSLYRLSYRATFLLHYTMLKPGERGLFKVIIPALHPEVRT